MSSPSWDYIAKLVCIGDSGCGKSSLTIRLCEGRFVTHHDVTIGVEFGSRIVPVGPPHSKSLPAPAQPTTSASSPPAAAAAADEPSSATEPAPNGLPPPPTTKKSQGPPAPQKHMKLSLWDTAGQETYKSVTRSYFRGASGALLVFDLTRRSTFLHATDWLNDLRQIAEPDIVVVLVGNKADLTMQSSSAAAEGSGSGGEGGENKREVTREEASEWARRNGVLEYVETSAKSGENVEEAFMRVAERIYQNIQAGKYDLNDRRSGVKGPSAGTAGSRSIKIEASKAAGGGCC
ncbi:Rab GTPase family protein [Pleurostoma richardsiae]|uniref:Rab GTPase family protein n=1 Tax=Pleurostoma richardsiae TaxID=41990 RepID=A0AA38RB05_9PEZI|nr:Rab GTPase family protein [Pleurostoma richardsiae]